MINKERQFYNQCDEENEALTKEMESLKIHYQDLLKKHHKCDVRIRNIENADVISYTPKPQENKEELDKRRREIHLRLLETGVALGKTPADVCLELLLLDNSAAEFGLEAPLFSLENNPEIYRSFQEFLNLKESEERGAFYLLREQAKALMQDEQWYKNKAGAQALKEEVEKLLSPDGSTAALNPLDVKELQNIFLYFFRDELTEVLKKESLSESEAKILVQTMEAFLLTDFGFYEKIQYLPPVLPNEVVLVYGVENSLGIDEKGREDNSWDVDGRELNYSKGFISRIKGLANLLNDEKGVREIIFGDTTLHGTYKIYGVIVDNKEILRIIEEIRNNKNKYWVEDIEEKSSVIARYKMDINEEEQPWRNLQGIKFNEDDDLPEKRAVELFLTEIGLAGKIEEESFWRERCERLSKKYLESPQV